MLENYRDLSRPGTDTGAGFQFEFGCDQCGRKWKSPFKPYRTGQLAGLIYKFAFFFQDRGQVSRIASGAADAGTQRAREKALAEAQSQAAERYQKCPGCTQSVCTECWNERTGQCNACTAKESQAVVRAGGGTPGGQTACPNCGAAASGRFCAECGFDMASTHKSCPGCGVMCLRQARFCTDCGHAF
jgi:hypothetical protein